jgi:hypothetical protein
MKKKNQESYCYRSDEMSSSLDNMENGAQFASKEEVIETVGSLLTDQYFGEPLY